MSRSAKTVYYFGFYMVFQTVLYLTSPHFVLHFFGIPDSAALWLRVIGGIMAVLTFYYILMARNEIKLFFRATVYGRITEFIALSLLVIFNSGPLVLLFFATMDLLGAIWTHTALRGESN